MIKKYKGMTIPDLIELLYKNNKKLDLIVSNDDYFVELLDERRLRIYD